MKRILITTLLLASIIGCNKEEKLELKTDSQKMYYSMGHQYGERLAELTPTEKELEYFYLGLKDGVFLQKEKVDVLKYSRLAGKQLTEARGKAAQIIKKDAEEELKKLINSDPDFIKSESGLIYKILKKGNKKTVPTLDQFAKIEFKAMHLDGTVFDQTSSQNIPTVPMKGIIKAWQEGLQLIGVGGEIKMIAPSELAYGDAGAPPKVKGGESIIFEMKLIRVTDKYKK